MTGFSRDPASEGCVWRLAWSCLYYQEIDLSFVSTQRVRSAVCTVLCKPVRNVVASMKLQAIHIEKTTIPMAVVPINQVAECKLY